MRYPEVKEIKMIESSCVRALLEVLSVQMLPISGTDGDTSSDQNGDCQKQIKKNDGATRDEKIKSSEPDCTKEKWCLNNDVVPI